MMKKIQNAIEAYRNYEKSDHFVIRKTFDVSSSLFKKSKETKPSLAINVKGDFKISVLKALLIIAGVMLMGLCVSMLLKAMVHHKFCKKYRR